MEVDLHKDSSGSQRRKNTALLKGLGNGHPDHPVTPSRIRFMEMTVAEVKQLDLKQMSLLDVLAYQVLDSSFSKQPGSFDALKFILDCVDPLEEPNPEPRRIQIVYQEPRWDLLSKDRPIDPPSDTL